MAMPARQPGARPPGGGLIESISSWLRSISHEMVEFEFHISPVEPRSDRLEDLSIQPYGVATGAEWQPVQVDAGDRRSRCHWPPALVLTIHGCADRLLAGREAVWQRRGTATPVGSRDAIRA